MENPPKIDGRQFTSSGKQRELFRLCLQVIRGFPIEYVPKHKYLKVKSIIERYKSGKISLEHIMEKARSEIFRGENDNQVIVSNGYRIEKNPLYVEEDNEKIFYMYLPKIAKDNIKRIFTKGIMSERYGSMSETNKFDIFQDNVVVVISTNVKPKYEKDDFGRKLIYYGLDVVRPQDIREIQYRMYENENFGKWVAETK